MNLNTYRYWWQQPKSDLHSAVSRYVEHLENNQTYRKADNLKHMRLYGNYEHAGLNAHDYSSTLNESSVKHRVTMNIVQSMIDTVTSKITKNKPKPTFLTDGGDWSLQKKAKKLTKFCEGIFNSTNLYQESSMVFLDACIFGTGALKIYEDDGEIKAERVFIDEIMVDDSESFYGKPRQIHQTKYIHKDVLKAMFPDSATAIEMDTDSAAYSSSDYSNAQDMIKVVESWHLRSSKKSTDGKHCITIKNATLFCEDYEEDTFPFVFFKWTVKPVGFFGQGISEQLSGLQLEINKILRTIQVSMHLTSIPKVFVEASSKVVTAHLNNKIGGIIRYAGTKPSYESVGTIPPELFSHLDRLYNKAYEVIGVSQLSARSLKPSGLDSGKALREFNDIESERFLETAKRFENFHIDCSEIMLKVARRIYKDKGKLNVTVKGKKFLESIDWSEVDLEEDKYMMEVFPTSALSNTPSGRLQDVQELLQAGFISKEDGLKLLDFPDLEATNNLLTADIENIERQIEMMIHKGQYETPEPYQNLNVAIKKAQQSYLKYKSDGAPEENLELLRRYIEDCQDILTQVEIAKNPPMQPPPLPMEAPLAEPQDLPNSELMPFDGVTPPVV